MKKFFILRAGFASGFLGNKVSDVNFFNSLGER